MRKYDKYREIEKKMRGLGESTAMRIELDLTHLFTFGLQGASYVNMDGETVDTLTGDAVQIFSNSHTITSSSTSVDNLVSTNLPFGRSGLEEAESLFTQMVNMNDVKVIPRPTAIVTSDWPAQVNVVEEFLGSRLAPDTAENATNVYSGKYQHIKLPLLATNASGAAVAAGRFYWMLMDLLHKDAILEFSEMPSFKMAQPDESGEEFDTDDLKTKSATSYAYGILDYKYLVGSPATS